MWVDFFFDVRFMAGFQACHAERKEKSWTILDPTKVKAREFWL